MTTNSIKLFDFPHSTGVGLQLRSITKDSEPWFVATDICKALSITNAAQAVQALDEDQRGISLIDTQGGPQRLIVVSESGLYSLVLRSRKEEAKAFRKWVTAEVLPTLRKDGLYVLGQEKPITDELTLPELMEQIAARQVKVDALNAAQVRAWSRHQEEKDARSDAFRFFKGKAPRVAR